MSAERPYGEFYDFYSVSPEYFGHTLIHFAEQTEGFIWYIQQSGFMNLVQKYHNCLRKTYSTMTVSISTVTLTWDSLSAPAVRLKLMVQKWRPPFISSQFLPDSIQAAFSTRPGNKWNKIITV
jgi:hypothetical protein